MKLLTYRINQKNLDLRRKFEFLNSLYWVILKNDKNWHYFLDPEGITLRLSPTKEIQIRKWFKKNIKGFGLTFRKRNFYEPRKHEYYGVSYLGDSLIGLFHAMSVILVLFPPKVSFRPTAERLNHGLVNMAGIHNFEMEAKIYLDLAEGRLRIIKKPLRPSRIVWDLYIKIKAFLKRRLI